VKYVDSVVEVWVRHQKLTHAVQEKLRLLQSYGILFKKKKFYTTFKNPRVFNGS
jgi:hypothetical protein